MDHSGPSQDLAPVQDPLWNHVLFPGFQRNAATADNQRIAALHDHHVFIVIVSVFGGCRIFSARPKCHLGAVDAVKDVTFDSASRLARLSDAIRWILHELRESVHVVPFFGQSPRRKAFAVSIFTF